MKKKTKKSMDYFVGTTGATIGGYAIGAAIAPGTPLPFLTGAAANAASHQIMGKKQRKKRRK